MHITWRDLEYLRSGLAMQMRVLLQGPLLELSSRLCMYAQPGGILVLSGFLEGLWPAIRAAYEAECQGFQLRQEGQWIAVTCTRKDDRATS